MAKLSLIRILQEFSDKLGGPVQLSKAISDAIPAADPEGKGPDSRTLSDILNEKTAPSLKHLKAIHLFLRQHGFGLDTVRIFEPDELLRSLVEPGEMTFYLPTIVFDTQVGGEKREYVSSWDFRAFCAVTDHVNEMGVHVASDFQTEPPQPPQAELGSVPWESFLTSGRRTYFRAIGSPLVCGLASYMLGKMFGVDYPFRPPPAIYSAVSPFYFCWYPKDDAAARQRYPSAFAANAADLESSPLNVSDELVKAIQERKAQAFVFDRHAHEVWLEENPHDQFGVIVAQRRGPQSIWVVIAGLSGPGTYACAKCLHQIKLSLPDYIEGQASPVVVAAVKSKVRSVIETDIQDQYRDAREPFDEQFIAPPSFWPG